MFDDDFHIGQSLCLIVLLVISELTHPHYATRAVIYGLQVQVLKNSLVSAVSPPPAAAGKIFIRQSSW
jgi:hypothetical protein